MRMGGGGTGREKKFSRPPSGGSAGERGVKAKIQPEPGEEWKGEDVSVGDVLNALNEIRRKFALAEASDEEHPQPRNCVMTLVAVGDTESDERRGERAAEEGTGTHPGPHPPINHPPR